MVNNTNNGHSHLKVCPDYGTLINKQHKQRHAKLYLIKTIGISWCSPLLSAVLHSWADSPGWRQYPPWPRRAWWPFTGWTQRLMAPERVTVEGHVVLHQAQPLTWTHMHVSSNVRSSRCPRQRAPIPNHNAVSRPALTACKRPIPLGPHWEKLDSFI